MGLFGSKKPKWQHKDPAIRLEAITNIDPGETELLLNLGQGDEDQQVRHAAINRLADVAALEALAAKADSEDLPVILTRKEALLYKQIIECQEDTNWQEILEHITSVNLISEIAVNAQQPDVRLAAVDRIEDQQLLARVVRQNCGKKPAAAAMAKITDEALLADLVESGASKTTRRLAADKIAAIEHQRTNPDDREIISQKLISLADETDSLVNAQDIDAAVLRMRDINREWLELDPEHAHPAYSNFRQTFENLETRYEEILERRKTGQEKTTRLEQFQARVDEICSTIERLSCSTAKDAVVDKERAVADWERLLKSLDTEVIPTASVVKRYSDACRTFDTNREKINRERDRIKDFGNSCAEIQELIADHNLKKAAAWLVKFNKRLNKAEFNYFNKSLIDKLVADVAADLKLAEENVRNEDLNKREEICSELEKLADLEKHRQVEEQLQNLKEAWQKLAKPENAKAKEFEQRFQNNVAALTEKLKTLEQEQDWELWANLKLKEKLLETVVALDHEENMEIVVNGIRNAQAEWKKIGPVPRKRSQEVWDDFQGVCNRNFERAKPYLDDLAHKRTQAMDRRREICALTAELADSSDWKKTASTIKDFQQEWKILLHGSRSEEQKLYKQFRSSCDSFFERRKEFYDQQDADRQQNLVAKEKLCEEAEQLAAEPQLNYPPKFKKLQAEWKKTGPAPGKAREAIWQRFRAACDTFFNWLDAEYKQNLVRKEELCTQTEKLVAGVSDGENREEVAAKLVELQEQWKEIGPVPRDRSEAVWQRFRESCDSFFAARKQQQKEENKQRRINQNQKEELLGRAEEIACQDEDKETGVQLQQLQKEWGELGEAPPGVNSELAKRFNALCDAFVEGNRQFFIELQAEQFTNLKNKESLCLRLENILGISFATGASETGNGLSLAEQLKQAMEDNFMLAGRRDEKKDIGGEVKRIRQEWENIGPVPYKQKKNIAERYKKALDVYYDRQRKQKEPERK